MKVSLATLALAPVLIWQGRRVRARTLRLPEPEGDRQGQLGEGKPLNLWVIGDSAAAGVGVDNQHQALIGQLTAQCAEHFHIRWQLHAQTGRTTHDMTAALGKMAPQAVDVVLVSLGVNDVTANTSARAFRRDCMALIERLKTQFSARHILFSAIPPMQQFPALPHPLRWFLGMRAELLNNTLHSVCRSQGCVYLKLALPAAPQWFARDGFHPGAPLYREWAKQAAVHIKRLCYDD